MHKGRRVRRSIGRAMVAAAVGMLIPTVVLGAVALVILRHVVSAFEEVVEEAMEEMHPVADLQLLLLRVPMPANDYLVHGSPSEREAFARLSGEVEKRFQDVLRRPFGLSEEVDLVQAAQRRWREIRAIGESILALPDPVNNPDGAEQMERLDALVYQAVEDLGRIHALAHREMENHLETARGFYGRMALAIFLLLFAGLAVASALAASLVRSILCPLGELGEAARRLGAGELSYRVPPLAYAELEKVGATFNSMAARLEADRAALEELAIQDPVTGLYNHRELHRRLHDEVERARRYRRPLSVLMFDLDHFKAFNDAHGHPAGDEALRAVAQAIRRQVRPADFPARYGGDEFALILPETPLGSAAAVAERIRGIVAATPVRAGASITVSVGAAAFPADGQDAPQLLMAADRALYAAKRAGRDRVYAGSHGTAR